MDVPPPASDAPRDDAALPPPPRAPPRPSALRFFAVVLALFVFPGSLVQAASPLLGLVWSEAAALLLPAVVAAAGANLRPGAALLLARRPTGAQLWLAAAVAIAAFFVAVPLGNLWVTILPQRIVHRFDVSRLFEQPQAVRVALAVVAATVAPFCEEAAFRGYILSALRARHAPGKAIAIATALFALMHLDPVRFPALLVLGAVFGWLAWRAGSLWPAVVAHATNNAIVAGLAVAGVEGAAAAPTRAEAVGALAVLGPAVFVLAGLASLYRRATPSPPAAEEALVPRDPADAGTRYDPRRLGPGLRRAISVAVVAFVAIAAVALLRRR